MMTPRRRLSSAWVTPRSSAGLLREPLYIFSKMSSENIGSSPMHSGASSCATMAATMGGVPRAAPMPVRPVSVSTWMRVASVLTLVPRSVRWRLSSGTAADMGMAVTLVIFMDFSPGRRAVSCGRVRFSPWRFPRGCGRSARLAGQPNRLCRRAPIVRGRRAAGRGRRQQHGGEADRQGRPPRGGRAFIRRPGGFRCSFRPGRRRRSGTSRSSPSCRSRNRGRPFLRGAA